MREQAIGELNQNRFNMDKGDVGMARLLVAVAASVWMGVGLFIPHPEFVLLPLYGLCPGDRSQPALFYGWMTASALTFVALALAGLLRNNRFAAVAFVGCLLMSTYIGIARAG